MRKPEIYFEESLSDDWSGDFEVKEVPLDHKPLFQVGVAIAFLGLIVAGRILFLGVAQAEFYGRRSEANLGKYERVAAPRGVITDRYGKVLAENKPVFSALLDMREFLKNKEIQEKTLAAIQEVLGIPPADAWNLIQSRDLERSSEPLVLKVELSQSQLVSLKEREIPAVLVRDGFRRDYPDGKTFSSVIGYIGLPNARDLANDPDLTGADFIGKAGVESFYENELRGIPGERLKFRNARGAELSEQAEQPSQMGKTLALTIDADLQKYFYERMSAGLQGLGRNAGVGIAMNPQNGEVLALVNFPAYDNNVFSTSGLGAERVGLLNNPDRPLFNRAVAGLYSPGSTVKPLVGLAALAEGVITPERTIFSPGYLDIPNPYNPDKPTRFEDWRFQGEVDLGAAIAQSSNVYFYTVGGGTREMKGLGITRLREWWQKFGFEEVTGIDLPGEESGFLPSIEWKERTFKRPWLLGDTYNVSIGQGDLQTTPLELINYISAIANGGVLRRPVVGQQAERGVIADYSEELAEHIREVQRGMRETVEAPLGTALSLNSLPFRSAGKTGSAQIQNNAYENAFFLGYAPADEPNEAEIAILVLVERARQGSLNAVPIARDVLSWYHEHRLSQPWYTGAYE